MPAAAEIDAAEQQRLAAIRCRPALAGSVGRTDVIQGLDLDLGVLGP